MKFGLPDSTIENIQKVFENNSKIDEVIVFGSRAKGNYKEGSDIDLAVKGRKIDFKDILRLSGQLDDLNLPYKIDLLDYAAINDKEVVEHIDRVGIVFYERWKKIKLEEICNDIVSGGTPLTTISEYYVNGTIPWIKTKEVLNNKIFTAENKITELGLKNSSAKLIPKNSIIVAMYGDGDTAGRVAINKLPVATNQACGNLIINDKVANFDFVFYFLLNSYDDLVYLKSGSGQQNLNLKALKEFMIRLPPPNEQNSIAFILSSLDDKIDLLHRQNKTLEQLAEKLFRQWFVEEVDESWGKGTLASISLFYNGKSRPNAEGTIPIYGGNGILGYTNDYNYSGQTIIIGRVGAYAGSLFYENKNIWVSDNALVAKGIKENYTHFLFYLLKTLGLNSMTEGSSHPLITQTLLKSIELIIPPHKKIEAFDAYVENLQCKIELNNKQIKTLTQLRDALLPKLMSGEVRVKIKQKR